MKPLNCFEHTTKAAVYENIAYQLKQLKKLEQQWAAKASNYKTNGLHFAEKLTRLVNTLQELDNDSREEIAELKDKELILKNEIEKLKARTELKELECQQANCKLHKAINKQLLEIKDTLLNSIDSQKEYKKASIVCERINSFIEANKRSMAEVERCLSLSQRERLIFQLTHQSRAEDLRDVCLQDLLNISSEIQNDGMGVKNIDIYGNKEASNRCRSLNAVSKCSSLDASSENSPTKMEEPPCLEGSKSVSTIRKLDLNAESSAAKQDAVTNSYVEVTDYNDCKPPHQYAKRLKNIRHNIFENKVVNSLINRSFVTSDKETPKSAKFSKSRDTPQHEARPHKLTYNLPQPPAPPASEGCRRAKKQLANVNIGAARGKLQAKAGQSRNGVSRSCAKSPKSNLRRAQVQAIITQFAEYSRKADNFFKVNCGVLKNNGCKRSTKTPKPELAKKKLVL